MLEIAFVQRLTKEKDEVIHNIQKRNKPIRVAKKSDGGRLSVEDYIPDGLATDSDDSRKMRRAKTRLRKKREIMHQKAIVNLRYSGLIFLVKPKLNPSNSIQFLISPSQIKKIWKQVSSTNFERFINFTNICFIYGKTRHWLHHYPRKNFVQ